MSRGDHGFDKAATDVFKASAVFGTPLGRQRIDDNHPCPDRPLTQAQYECHRGGDLVLVFGYVMFDGPIGIAAFFGAECRENLDACLCTFCLVGQPADIACLR